MTTPPTTAGWYPDPDGSGGQRYWDGAAWTAQRPDAPESTEETAVWPAELPPWPEGMEMPSWEDAGKAEPAPVVEDSVEDSVEDAVEDSVDDVVVEDAAVEEPATEAPTAEVDEPESVVPEPVVPEPVVFYPAAEEPTAVAQPVDQPTAVVPTFPRPADPAAFAAAPVATQSRPIKGYLAAVAALLVVLVGVLVWAFAFANPDTDATEATGAGGTSEAAGTTPAATDSADPTEVTGDESAAAVGQAVDGDVTITSNGVEITPTVSAVSDKFLTKSAAGEFVVVRLTLLNNGELPATFLSDQQVLTAGGQTYNVETESTFYLGGISALLEPGQPVDVAFAFDVPPGTAPESLEVHGDLGSEGAVIGLT